MSARPDVALLPRRDCRIFEARASQRDKAFGQIALSWDGRRLGHAGSTVTASSPALPMDGGTADASPPVWPLQALLSPPSTPLAPTGKWYLATMPATTTTKCHRARSIGPASTAFCISPPTRTAMAPSI